MKTYHITIEVDDKNLPQEEKDGIAEGIKSLVDALNILTPYEVEVQ